MLTSQVGDLSQTQNGVFLREGIGIRHLVNDVADCKLHRKDKRDENAKTHGPKT